MQITVYPQKINLTEVEIHLDVSIALQLGTVLRFDSETPFYGEVIAFEESNLRESQVARIKPLYGRPSFSFRKATVVEPDALSAELEKLQGPPRLPLPLGSGIQLDAANLNTFTLVEGSALYPKRQLVMGLTQALKPYHAIAVFDPIGLFYNAEGFASLNAGADFKLSIQKVGMRRFLEALKEQLPFNLDDQTILQLAKPITGLSQFVPFNYFMYPDRIPELTLKPLLTQCLNDIQTRGLFADLVEEVFSAALFETHPHTVLNFAGIPEPWQQLYIEHCLKTLTEQPVSQMIVVVVYPEKYFKPFGYWLEKLNLRGIRLIGISSNYDQADLPEWANNRFEITPTGHIDFTGTMSLQFPIQFELNDFLQAQPEATRPSTPPPQDPPTVEADEDVIEEDGIEADPFSFQLEESSTEFEEEAHPEDLHSAVSPEELELLDEEDPFADFLEDTEDSVDDGLDTESEEEIDAFEVFEAESEPEEATIPEEEDTEEPSQDLLPIYKTLDDPDETAAVEFEPGDKIRHKKYGIGTISKIIPMENSLILNVNFEKAGKRLLDPSLSHIEKL